MLKCYNQAPLSSTGEMLGAMHLQWVEKDETFYEALLDLVFRIHDQRDRAQLVQAMNLFKNSDSRIELLEELGYHDLVEKELASVGRFQQLAIIQETRGEIVIVQETWRLAENEDRVHMIRTRLSRSEAATTLLKRAFKGISAVITTSKGLDQPSCQASTYKVIRLLNDRVEWDAIPLQAKLLVAAIHLTSGGKQDKTGRQAFKLQTSAISSHIAVIAIKNFMALRPHLELYQDDESMGIIPLFNSDLDEVAVLQSLWLLLCQEHVKSDGDWIIIHHGQFRKEKAKFGRHCFDVIMRLLMDTLTRAIESENACPNIFPGPWICQEETCTRQHKAAFHQANRRSRLDSIVSPSGRDYEFQACLQDIWLLQ